MMDRPEQFLRGTPLAGAPSWLDITAIAASSADISWRDIHSASMVLAARLDGAGAVCNLAESRAGFLIASIAALRRGCMQILPASRGQIDLDAALTGATCPMVLVDRASAFDASRTACFDIDSTVSLAPAVASDDALRWSPHSHSSIVRLFTSGTTARAALQDKTLDQLVSGALGLGKRLDAVLAGGLASVSRLLCSVPSQHMFGLETSVMLPLVHGLTVIEGRPLLPEDIRDALEGGQDAGWVTTPLHLRALVREGIPIRGCRVAISSTMSLDPALAADAESLLGCTVVEIYGSTETGVLATRRTACEQAWTPLDGVRAEQLADGCRVAGTHFQSPQVLGDRIEPLPGGRFLLHGRRDDTVKIAGRRVSVESLNSLLPYMPGLVDGVFHYVENRRGNARLVLFHEGTLDRRKALAWLRERIDPAFVPRALIGVDRLPRSEVGKVRRAALDSIYADWLAGQNER